MMTLARADIDSTITPYWRWQAALEAVQTPSKRKVTPEPEIAELMAYLRDAPCLRRSVIDTAREIFETDNVLRAELESRILAGQSDDEIASHCDLPVEAVALYEEMFFFVRRYLHATDWLLSHTNDRARWYGYENHQLRQLWCWYALAGGPIIVDYLIGVYRTSAGSAKTPRIDLYFSRKSTLKLNEQGTIALFMIPIGWDPVWDIELGVRCDEIAAMEDPDCRQRERDNLHREYISLARRVVSGKPPKRPCGPSKQGYQPSKVGRQASKIRSPRDRYPDMQGLFC